MIKFLEKYGVVCWFFVLLIAITIFYVSSLSFESAPARGYGWKTVAYHFLAFFSLAFFLLPALVKGKNKNWVFVGVVLGVLYGVLDEFHQFFVPRRACTLSDVLVDSCGVLFASLIYTVSLRYRKNHL